MATPARRAIRPLLNAIGILPYQRGAKGSIKNYINTYTGQIIPRRRAEQSVIGETYEQRQKRRIIESQGIEKYHNPRGREQRIVSDFIRENSRRTGEILTRGQAGKSASLQRIEDDLKAGNDKSLSRDERQRRLKRALILLGRRNVNDTHDVGETP